MSYEILIVYFKFYQRYIKIKYTICVNIFLIILIAKIARVISIINLKKPSLFYLYVDKQMSWS